MDSPAASLFVGVAAISMGLLLVLGGLFAGPSLGRNLPRLQRFFPWLKVHQERHWRILLSLAGVAMAALGLLYLGHPL